MSRPNTAPRPTPVRTFSLWGDMADPVTPTVARLRRDWEQHRAEVVFDCATSGPQRHTFAGPLLREVVAVAQPRFGPLRRKERSRFLLAVSGGDGHHTVLSWAEIDADFGNAPVLLATRMDGRDLDEAGTQFVVPHDRRGARYVSAVTGIRLGSHRRTGLLPAEA
ncbi:molybdopterin-dependent oxidoreductase [Streptomyces sp. A0958]|uniref:molybdopterin-dependent oxidoreductase n=1 Tax=Streptomyces sp. A0958 TaxID=2563101 RepID=UPI00109E4B24|nr:molybdopterin-dependent oxidoreductase [Streptomyces sp. A0958]THA71031.1 molybdopterin-dependent oxidoreductase [Streptomyces sp. A0958]